VGEITATPVAGNRVQQAIGITTHATTDVHTRVETNRDTKITASETPADLIIITRDLIIITEDFAQTLVTATNATGTTAHHERGPQCETLTHIVIDQQRPVTSKLDNWENVAINSLLALHNLTPPIQAIIPPLLRIPILIFDIQAKGLIDTGAAASLLSSEVLFRLRDKNIKKLLNNENPPVR